MLFEYPGSAHTSTWLVTIDENRVSKVVWSAVNQRATATAKPFAAEIAELVKAHGGDNLRVGLEVLITETGVAMVSCYPFDDALLGRTI